jgi:hypothetical protein
MTKMYNTDEERLRIKEGFKNMNEALRQKEPAIIYTKEQVKNLPQLLLSLQSGIQTPFPISNNKFIMIFVHKNGNLTEIFWDLTKENLEEQSEETQRAISICFEAN